MLIILLILNDTCYDAPINALGLQMPWENPADVTERRVKMIRFIVRFVLRSYVPAMAIIAIFCAQHSNSYAGDIAVDDLYAGRLLPDEVVDSFSHGDQFFATRTVKSGRKTPLPYASQPLENFVMQYKGRQYDLYDILSLNRIAGLLVLKKGEIAFETMQLGQDHSTRWMSMSVTKTISGLLVGAAIQDGYISSVDDPVTKYVPALVGTAYDGVTIRHVLTMRSGIAWTEVQADPKSSRGRLLAVQKEQRPGAWIDFVRTLERQAPPGEVWNYSTGESQVLTAVLTGALDMPVSEYLSKRIWKPIGAERSAHWWLDARGGTEIGGSGFSAVLRDYGRLGLFLLNEGRVADDQVLPDGWMTAATMPQQMGESFIPYGYQLWLIDKMMKQASGQCGQQAYGALGAYGQVIYINPSAETVIVILSALPKAMIEPPIDHLSVLASICEALL